MRTSGRLTQRDISLDDLDAERLQKAVLLALGYPSDGLGEKLLIIGIFEGGRAMAELDVNHAGFYLGASPSKGFSAFGMGGGEKRRRVFRGAVAPVDFVVQEEVAEA